MGKRRMWKISLLYWVSKGKGSENVWTDKFYCLIYLHSFRHGQRLLSSYRLKQSLSPSMCFSTSVCVCEAPYWLLMVKSPWSERWGLEWQPGDGANGGSERWRDGGWRMGAGAWGPIPSTEAIVRSECWSEEVEVEDELAKGRKGEILHSHY